MGCLNSRVKQVNGLSGCVINIQPFLTFKVPAFGHLSLTTIL
jgi:hypothetical protein